MSVPSGMSASGDRSPRGSESFETGSPTFETGSPTFETGSPAFETGSPAFETGSPAFETGEPRAVDPEGNTGAPPRAVEPEVGDAELVERAIAGSDAAFEILVERYQQAIYNVAYYKSHNSYDAEDLTQDIFLSAYRALATLKDTSSFGGWLFGIAYNRCHKWYRRERTKIVKFQEIARRAEEEQRLATKARSPGESHPLREALSRLPREISETLRLKFLEGRSYVEISERLGIAHHRIDYLIRKGKRLLRERIESDGMASPPRREPSQEP